MTADDADTLPTRAETPAARRGRPSPDEVREKVVRIAGELLTECGYLAMTVDELATRAGVSKKTLYRWWPNKAAIVAEVLAERTVVHPVPDLGDTRRELLLVFELAVEYARGADMSAVVFILEAAGDEAAVVRDLIDRVIAPRRDLARGAVQRGIARGDLPPDIDIDALIDLWSGFAAFRQTARSMTVSPHIADQLVDLALAGHTPRLPHSA
jgi:AcrR family transcriptional regulator